VRKAQFTDVALFPAILIAVAWLIFYRN
jgi:hypothetical protein